MNLFKRITALSFCGALFGAAATISAEAQSLEGQWMSVGTDYYGGQFVIVLAFRNDGDVQVQMSQTPAPNGYGVSNTSSCEGQYRFDGSTLEAGLNVCQSCTPSGCFIAPQVAGLLQPMINGPVQMQDEYTISINSSVYHRH
jgi:hypothetical protein